MSASPITYQAAPEEMHFLLMLKQEQPQPAYRARYNFVIRNLIEAGFIEYVEGTGMVRLTDLGNRFINIT